MYRFFSIILAALIFTTAGWGQGQNKATPAKAPPAAAFLMQQGTDAFLKRFDKNRDGVLSREEAPPFLAKLFDKFDANHDGRLDRSEIEQLRRVLLRRFGVEANTAAKAKPAQAAKPAPNPASPDFDALDRNADGRLTRDELKGTPFASRFDEIDTNHDGQIDRREFEAFLEREAQKKKS